ncbi:MAG TPA: LuxR C-terminal-related transcriptional regulator [Marmoricola sp.]|nr:LuxR C-terminal-related transcriptional regulator [Marmoricola sp.]
MVDLVLSNRLVTLAGPGGAGKTRLAAQVLDDLETRFEDGAFFADLSELTDPALLGNLVAGCLDLHLPGAGWDVQLLIDRLDSERVLLVLDNCEHLLDAVATLTAAVLASCPGTTFLATSRIPLGLSREVVHDVASLPVPAPGMKALHEIRAVAAVQLFVERAQVASTSFDLTEANAASVAGLVAALDGHPLSLELAAARVREIAPQVLLERLGDHLSLLASGFRDQPERHQSLAGSLDWSYQLCTPGEQALWCRLAVFRGGFELDAAEAVGAGDGIARHEVLPLVSALCGQSVLTQESGRYRMLEPVRQFGLRQLTDAGQLVRWQDSHFGWARTLAGTLGARWFGSEQLSWIGRLRAEHANLRGALEHGLTRPEHSADTLQMCRDLEIYWLCDGLNTEGRHWVGQALAAATDIGDAAVEAASMAAWFAATQGDAAAADRLLAVAAGGLGDAGQRARARHLMACSAVALYQRDPERALSIGRAAAAALDSEGHHGTHDYVQATFWAGLALASLERADEALVLIDEALAICDRRAGEQFVRASFLWLLGCLQLNIGDPAAALRNERAALECSWALRYGLVVAFSLEAIATANAGLGHANDAATLFGAAASEQERMQVETMFTEVRDAGIRTVERAIGPDRYAEAYAAGAGASLSSAVAFAVTGQDPRSAVDPYEPLTRREAEIAGLIADGLSNRAIAQRLVISERTVHGHVSNTLDKLHAPSRAAVAVWYLRRSALPEAPLGSET